VATKEKISEERNVDSWMAAAQHKMDLDGDNKGRLQWHKSNK